MSSQNNHFIYLIDDDDSFRLSLEGAFIALGYTVHSFKSVDSFFQHENICWPAIIITDVRMPEKTGIDLQQRLIDENYGLPLIFISGESSLAEAITGMRRGAIDFLQKPFNMEDLLKIISNSFENQKSHLAKAHKRIIRDATLNRLAPREREVCELMAMGFSNPKMAQQLTLSIETIKQYKKSVYEKLNLGDLAELIAFMRN